MLIIMSHKMLSDQNICDMIVALQNEKMEFIRQCRIRYYNNDQRGTEERS